MAAPNTARSTMPTSLRRCMSAMVLRGARYLHAFIVLLLSEGAQSTSNGWTLCQGIAPLVLPAACLT